ncbi:MAG: hypothetical protein IT453_16905, partial [Planctomycetes bacterium]|nr:hypothetical protein [Planctomycetota bacterium]
MSRARIGDGGSTSCARVGTEPRLAAGRRKRWLRAIGAPVIALAIACAACSDGASTSARERSSSLAPDEPQHTLTAADLASFRPGRARREIQAELGGRVGRAWLVDCGDRRLGTLGFELISAGESDRRSGLRFDALFEDDRFVKLVERPYDEPGPATVDDCAWLARALEWPALDAAELE